MINDSYAQNPEFLKDHVTLKTEAMTADYSDLSSQE